MMPKTSDAMRKAIKSYKDKHDEIRFAVRLGAKDEIRNVAIKKGYPSMQKYLIALIEKDSDLKL